MLRKILHKSCSYSYLNLDNIIFDNKELNQNNPFHLLLEFVLQKQMSVSKARIYALKGY